MGGYGSGRRKQHHITNDCLPIDTSFLLKRKMLTGKLKQGANITFTSIAKDVKGKATETKHNFYCLVERYMPDTPGEFSKWDAVGHVTLLYGVRIGNEDKGKQHAELPLVVTHPNYGGTRYWFLAPCCGRRVRVVYLPTFDGAARILPECRECLNLHYASQQQSYIERHKTYERHLLANYGWAWAEMEYHCLREHYLEITPEVEHLRLRSVLEMRMRMLRHLISFARVLLRTHVYNLRSLKSEEDRQAYLDHVRKQEGESYGLDLVRLLETSCQIERDAHESSSAVFDRAYNQWTEELIQTLLQDTEDTAQSVEEAMQPGYANIRFLLAHKQQLEEDIERLEKMKPAA